MRDPDLASGRVDLLEGHQPRALEVLELESAPATLACAVRRLAGEARWSPRAVATAVGLVELLAAP